MWFKFESTIWFAQSPYFAYVKIIEIIKLFSLREICHSLIFEFAFTICTFFQPARTELKGLFAPDDNDAFLVIFSCHQVWTVTLVTIQPIPKVVLMTWKVCVVIAKCERVP